MVKSISGKRAELDRQDRTGRYWKYCIDHLIPTGAVNGGRLLEVIHHSIASGPYRSQSKMYLAELLKPWDTPARIPEFTAVKEKEIKGLIEAGSFEVVLHEIVPKNTNILGSRFVLAIKNKAQTKRYIRRVMLCRDTLIARKIFSYTTAQTCDRVLFGL